MAPETLSLWDILKWLASALGAVALWGFRMFSKRVDQHELNHTQLVEKVRELEFSTVGKDTFQKHVSDTTDRLDAMRKEAIGREDRIVAEIRGLGTRIDTLFQRADK